MEAASFDQQFGPQPVAAVVAAPVVEAPVPAATPPPDATPAAPAADAAAAVETPAVEAPRDDKGRFVSVAVHAREVTQKNERIAQLEEQLAAAQAKASDKPTTKNLESVDALREKLKDEAPEFVMEVLNVVESELVKRDEAQAKTNEELNGYKAREAEAARARQADEDAARQQLLQQVPVLGQWQTAATAAEATPETKALWQRAVKHEADLRATGAAKWSDDATRFRQAAQRAAEDLGIELKPEQLAAQATAATSATPPAATPKPLPKADDLPASLSQVPSPRAAAPSQGFAGEALSLNGAIHATKGLNKADLQRVLLGAG